jgi:hypothetical protein
VWHRLSQIVEEHRQILHDRAHAQDAQRLLGRLIVGRLTLFPLPDHTGYRFTGEGTLVPLLSGLVPQNVASPTGTNWSQQAGEWVESDRWVTNVAGKRDRVLAPAAPESVSECQARQGRIRSALPTRS